METILLTKQNAHRVTMVRRKDSPESTPLVFNFRGKRPIGIGNFYHLIGEGESERVLPLAEFDQWEVAEVSHPGYLDEYWEAAYRAHYWTSQRPETLGEDDITRHEKELHEDLQKMPEDQRARYTENYKHYFSDILSSLSRCASAFVTGPAKFNIKRNEKANNTYENKYKAFREWRERAFKGIEKHIESQKTGEQRNEEAWQAVKKDIDRVSSDIRAIHDGKGGGYCKSIAISNFFGRMATHAYNGNVEIIEKAVAYVREINAKEKKPFITERHQFFKLPEVAKSKKEAASQENREVCVNGVRVVLDYKEKRLQFFFDSKPEKEVRERLHKEFSFNWSHKNQAWQRILTDNAIRAAKRFLNVQTL